MAFTGTIVILALHSHNAAFPGPLRKDAQQEEMLAHVVNASSWLRLGSSKHCMERVGTWVLLKVLHNKAVHNPGIIHT